MNSDPFFSIIIPLYNKNTTIESTLNSVINQSFLDFEILVVDDLSTDEGLKKIALHQNRKVKIIEKKTNTGVSDTRNIGILNAIGRYVVFLDADDKLDRCYLEVARKELTSLERKVDIMFFNNYIGYEHEFRKQINTKSYFGVNSYRGKLDCFFKLASHHKGSCPHITSAVVNRNFLNATAIRFPVGITHTEDTAFLASVALHTSDIYFTDYPAFFYYLDSANNSKSTRPTKSRYVIQLLESQASMPQYGAYFVCKNLIHLAYNCLEFDDLDGYKQATNSKYFSLESASRYYIPHILAHKLIPYRAFRLLYIFAKRGL